MAILIYSFFFIMLLAIIYTLKFVLKLVVRAISKKPECAACIGKEAKYLCTTKDDKGYYLCESCYKMMTVDREEKYKSVEEA